MPFHIRLNWFYISTISEIVVFQCFIVMNKIHILLLTSLKLFSYRLSYVKCFFFPAWACKRTNQKLISVSVKNIFTNSNLLSALLRLTISPLFVVQILATVEFNRFSFSFSSFAPYAELQRNEISRSGTMEFGCTKAFYEGVWGIRV